VSEFQYPTSNELMEIAQDKVPRLEENRPIFQYFPTTESDSVQLTWEQEDNYLGLQQVRGLGGDPPRINKVGLKRYTMLPGIYGEYEPIDEIELMERRKIGTWGTPIEVSDLVVKAQDRLLMRRRDRQESILWTLVLSGVFSVAGPSGAILHTDAYTTQTFNALIGWGTTATATPLADFRAVQLLARGHSVNFGPRAKAYANQVTVNKLLSNTNALDIAGRRGPALATLNSLQDMNTIFLNEGLPQIEIYDEGYLSEPSGTFVPYIPDDVVAVFGARSDGARVGEYRMVRNVNNPNMEPGAYQKVIDHGDKRVPRLIEVHDGHNGGPVIFFPSAIVVMDVS
jgi:hypothetical protein